VQKVKPLTKELSKLRDKIHQYAIDYGLDFYPVIFEMCDYDTVNILAAQGGFPARYPHWRFGMDYEQLSKSYAYGLQKIYEMVINTSPCYAYLLMANNIVDQKTVMAHVYGHADFFKNNCWFSSSNRKMMDVMANHGTKVRRYIEKYGQDRVETFIDQVLSLENLLDPNLLFTSKANSSANKDMEEFDPLEGASTSLRSFLSSKLNKNESTQKKVSEKNIEDIKDPFFGGEITNRDLMKFLMINAPIEEWQTDVIAILREEAYYFLPQRMTKIMNEGWASYWHSKIMTQNALECSEIIDFADHHAGVMAMSKTQINPYKIGIELFRDIEHRWDTGKFGKEYTDCTDMEKRESWNKSTDLGRKKIFEVRKTHNDLTFIDEFFTREFCERQQLFTSKVDHRTGKRVIDSREFEKIKSGLLSSLTNFGQPLIEVEGGNYQNRGELMLNHIYQGTDLDLSFATETLKNIQGIWKRPVNIKTIQDKKDVILSFDGKEFKINK